MYIYFLKKYDCVKLGKFSSKKCKVSFFAKYIHRLNFDAQRQKSHDVTNDVNVDFLI